jgi:hypothetical protein
MEMNWISVKDALPEIPKDRFAVSVLVVTYDRMEAESYRERHGSAHPMIGVSVSDGTYGYTHYSEDRLHHKAGDPISPWFEGTTKEKDFMTWWMGKDVESGPFGDPVTHWMYLPKAPQEYDYRKEFGYPEKSE